MESVNRERRRHMPATKDKKRNTWTAQFYYTDWTGKKVKKCKRGFETKKEALDWEKHFLLEKSASLRISGKDMRQMSDRRSERTHGSPRSMWCI